MCPAILVLPVILAPRVIRDRKETPDPRVILALRVILDRKATPDPRETRVLRVILVSVSLLVARRVRC